MKVSQIPRRLKSQGILLSFSKEQIDAEKGIIKDVIMCQTGPAKGHGVHLEEEFIKELVAYDQKHFKKTGIKARFGHPAFSDTTMGKQMGKFHNIRYQDGKAIGDLHLLDSANISPTHPGIKDWMLSMAQECEDFVMSSIVFRASRYYQRDSNGKKIYVWEYDDDENWKSSNSELGNVYVEFGKEGEHFYTDMVEAGAATDNLFSQQFNQDKFAIQVVEFVQEHPDLLKFLQGNPTKVTEFCDKLDITLPKPTYSFGEKFTFLKSFFGSSDKESALSQLNTEFEKAKKAFQDQLAEKDRKIAAQQKELTNKDEKIKELSERIPEDHTSVETDTDKPGTKYSSVTQKAIERYDRLKKNK